MPQLWLLAQATPIAPGTDPATASRLADIALRRWFNGLTLSPNSASPSLTPWMAWVAGLAALALLALLAQGPARLLTQLFDIPGHFRVVFASLGRFRRAGRLVAVLFGSMVLSWTSWQALHHTETRRAEDLAILLKNHPWQELAVEQGGLTAVTALRDLGGLADTSILLLAAGILYFRLSAERWNRLVSGPVEEGLPLAGTSVPAWGCAWLYLFYRGVGMTLSSDGLPLNRLFGVDVVLIPVLTLACDSLILAWVLNELRHAFSEAPAPPLDESLAESLRLWPAAIVACLCILPARYLALTAWLSLPYLPGNTPESIRGVLREILRGNGLTWLQAVSLPLLPLVGVAAWGGSQRGRRGGLLRDTFALLRAEGGRLIAVVMGGTFACAGLSYLAYLALLSLPPQPWVLSAADSYSHYATLPAALLLAATLVELAGRALRTPDDEAAEVSEGEASPEELTARTNKI